MVDDEQPQDRAQPFFYGPTVRALLKLGLIFGLGLAFLIWTFVDGRNHEFQKLLKQAVAQADSDAHVQSAIGKVQSTKVLADHFLQPSLRSKRDGHAEVRVRLLGERANATLYFEASSPMNGGGWTIDRMEVAPDGGEVIVVTK